MKRFFHYFLLLLLACSSVWLTPSFGSAGQEKVRVGFFEFHGYHQRNDFGAPSGYGYEYLQNIAAYTGWQYEYVGYEQPWGDMLALLKEGQIDLLTSVQKSPERLRDFDFSANPIGYSASALTIRVGNTAFPVGNYAQYNNIRIGLLHGNSRNQDLVAFAKKHGFTYRPSYYHHAEELCLALQQGRVDAALTSTLRTMNNEVIVDLFNSKPFYAVVRKGRKDLLRAFNQAQDQLHIYAPLLETKLWAKYYAQSERIQIFSVPELAELEKRRQSGRPLTILINPDRRPLSYFESGAIKGIVPQIAQKIMTQLDLPYEILRPKNRIQYQQLLNSHSADLCFDFTMNFALAEQYGYRLVGSYLTLEVKEFRRMGNDHHWSVAVIDGDDTHNLPFSVGQHRSIVPCSTYIDCLSAVRLGKADSTYLNTYSAEFYQRHMHKHSLVTLPVLDTPMTVSVGVSHKIASPLTTAFQKSVLSLRDQDILPVISDVLSEDFQPSLKDFIDSYFTEILLITLLLAVAVGLSWSTTLYIHRQKLRLSYLNRHDLLTGLYHRLAYYNKVGQLLKEHPHLRFAFVKFDIERFQLINAFYGRKEGDRVLLFVADCLRETMHHHEPCGFGRISADVFGACIPYTDTDTLLDTLGTFQNRIKNFSKNFEVVSVFGVYFIAHNEESLDSIFAKATLACKSVKGNYINTIARYEPEMSQRIEQIQTITNQVRTALKDNQFEVFLQARYSLHDNRLCGAESLLRWRHPLRGLISPDQFLSIFEANGFITKLDAFVWEQVCRYQQRRLNLGATLFPISLHISRASLQHGQCVEHIAGLLDRYQIDPRLVTAEISESVYMIDPAAMSKVVDAFHSHQIRVFLDDFGNGYSSLSALKDMPVDQLKMDLRLFDTGSSDLPSDGILATVIRMSRKINIPVIVEGVDSHERLEQLKAFGCAYVQGYFLSPPLPLYQFESVLEKGLCDSSLELSQIMS